MTFTFQITPHAIEAMEKLLKDIPAIEHPVIAPIRSRSDVGGPGWMLGVYEKKNLGSQGQKVVKVLGYEFYIDPSMSNALSERTLDFIDGHFDVI